MRLLCWFPLCLSAVLIPQAWASVAEPTPVQLDLYMETLCPYCARFVKEQLSQLFIDDVASIMNLTMIPWVCSRGDSALSSTGQAASR
jgi:protein-disulfide isomerase